jgi:hypothetical protein
MSCPGKTSDLVQFTSIMALILNNKIFFSDWAKSLVITVIWCILMPRMAHREIGLDSLS